MQIHVAIWCHSATMSWWCRKTSFSLLQGNISTTRVISELKSIRKCISYFVTFPLNNSTREESWASYQTRKITVCACAGNAGNVFPIRRFRRKPLVSDPGMHHGTSVTHVPWCMSGSLTCGDGENVPGIPGACAPAILRIWQEAHGKDSINVHISISWMQI